ncbi:endonuclease domain-containing protein [Devosia sp. ZB163]|uniref:endonuclease domain-containing protein n=1 Tax=Devosia sp. ZB163 TaxID=3025938 RepID=UPI00235EAF9B|nr:endonuclease domain-containing protein [Devosia sp. ZB163]MDC9823128.1 endonuclease domain-containing protein [Devosia sp. ZB163]
MGTLKSRFVARARSLRENSTDAERKLWYRLRDRQLLGCKFVRQQPVGSYVVDFACRERDLIVELDGGQHGTADGVLADAGRTEVLSQHGYRVVRFWNSDVLTNIDGVLQVIADRLEKAPSPGLRFAKSDLSPKGEVARGHTRMTGELE